jgi:FtsK/SpoIIIE family.
MSVLSHIKRRWKKAGEKATDLSWKRSYAKRILPSRIEIFDTNLLFNQRTVVRCLVCGVQMESGSEGYPRDFSSKTMEAIQAISFQGVKIMMSAGIIQLPGGHTKEELQRANFDAEKQQLMNQLDKAGSKDLELIMKSNDIVHNYSELYYKNQKSFHASLIVVLKGSPEKVFEAESQIVNLIHGESIEIDIPSRRQMEMLQTALPGPDANPRSWVDVRTTAAAVMASATNLNSKTDDNGLYFGKDLLTNGDVFFDLDTLASKNMVVCGATRSGKTFTFMELLMRLLYMKNARVIYTTPKGDATTNYRSVAGFFGDRGGIADIGLNGTEYLNPLDILIDEETMGNSQYAYEKAYDLKKDILIHGHRVWLGHEFTSNMESYLDESLDWAYEHAGVYRDEPESFKNQMPTYNNLRFKWELDKDNEKLGTKARTAEALFNKSYQFSETGLFRRYNNQTQGLDLNKDFIIIDMAGVPEAIKPFMSVIVNGTLATRFSTDVERETYLAVDEGAVYLRDKELAGNLLKTLTQGSSHKFYLWVATQQASDFKKNNVAEEFQTNTFINIILGNNLKNGISTAKDYFGLTEEECSILAGCTVGEGILLFGDERVPIRFEPSELEKKIIKGENYTEEKVTAASEFSFKREYKWLISEQKMVISDWMDGDSSVLLQQGYEKHKVARISKPGRVVAYLPRGAVINGRMQIPHLGTMSLDHYASVIQLGALMQDEKFDEISINHNDEEDCRGKKNEKLLAMEYEKKGSHTAEQLLQKKATALGKCMEVRFVCSSEDYSHISGIVGTDYCLQRGSSVADFLHNFGNPGMSEEQTLVSGESVELTGETEALEA